MTEIEQYDIPMSDIPDDAVQAVAKVMPGLDLASCEEYDVEEKMGGGKTWVFNKCGSGQEVTLSVNEDLSVNVSN